MKKKCSAKPEYQKNQGWGENGTNFSIKWRNQAKSSEESKISTNTGNDWIVNQTDFGRMIISNRGKRVNTLLWAMPGHSATSEAAEWGCSTSGQAGRMDAGSG